MRPRRPSAYGGAVLAPSCVCVCVAMYSASTSLSFFVLKCVRLRCIVLYLGLAICGGGSLPSRASRPSGLRVFLRAEDASVTDSDGRAAALGLCWPRPDRDCAWIVLPLGRRRPGELRCHRAAAPGRRHQSMYN